MLRYAFPFTVYKHQRRLEEKGQGIALRSISQNLRQTVNPRDIVQDAIHNFSPAYQHYASAHAIKDAEAGSGSDGNHAINYQVTIRDRVVKNKDSGNSETAMLLNSDEDV